MIDLIKTLAYAMQKLKKEVVNEKGYINNP